MKKTLILTFTLLSLHLSAQYQFKAEVNGGIFFTDLITTLFDDEPRSDRFFGYGGHISSNFYFSHDIGERFYMDYGAGYSRYHFLVSESSEDNLPYFNFKIVANYRSFIKNTDLTVGLTNHILLLDDLRNRGAYGNRRFFSNLDVGFCFHPLNSFDIKLTTPLTVIYMNKAKVGSFNGPTKQFKVGVTGINLGVVYKFGGNKE